MLLQSNSNFRFEEIELVLVWAPVLVRSFPFGADDVRTDFLRERGFEFPPNAEEFRNLNSMPKMEKNRFFLFVPLLSFFSVGACVRV